MNPGTYRVTPVAAESGLSEAKSGNLQAFVLLRVIEDQPGACVGESITWFGSFTPAATGRTKEQLEIMGVTYIADDGSLVGIGETIDKPGEPLVVVVDVRQEEYEGKVSLKAGFVRRVGGSAVRVSKVTERAKIASAQALFGSPAGAAGTAGAAKQQPPLSKGNPFTRR